MFLIAASCSAARADTFAPSERNGRVRIVNTGSGNAFSSCSMKRGTKSAIRPPRPAHTKIASTSDTPSSWKQSVMLVKSKSSPHVYPSFVGSDGDRTFLRATSRDFMEWITSVSVSKTKERTLFTLLLSSWLFRVSTIRQPAPPTPTSNARIYSSVLFSV